MINDKGKWFTTDNNDTFIQCTTKHLIDCLSILFNQDYERAGRVCKELRPVTEEEYYKYKLYEDEF